MAQNRRKVVWFEGMALDPHHLQQSDRHQQHTLNARIRSLSSFPWGFSELTIDQDRLANGEFALTRGRGVMPDGLYFDIPEHDPKPPPRALQEHFPSTEERLAVSLAIPVEQRSGANYTLEKSASQRETRFHTQTVDIPDANTGMDTRQIEVARANFQIRFGNEPMGAYTDIQIAEVVRSTGGAFALKESYIPPCLRLSASAHLQTTARQILELLVTKSSSFTDRRRDILSQREISPPDVMALNLLGTVNTFIPLLNHHLGSTAGHPEALFRTLLALAGQLSAHLDDARVHPRDLPTYDHKRLTHCFHQISDVLRGMLGEAAPRANYHKLPLTQVRENHFTVDIDEQMLEDAQFFLIVRSEEISEEKLLSELPSLVRIASPDTIDAVLRSYTRALSIESTRRLPAGLPVDSRASYFRLRKRGPFWEAIQEHQAMALFIPSELSEIDLDLIAVE